MTSPTSSKELQKKLYSIWDDSHYLSNWDSQRQHMVVEVFTLMEEAITKATEALLDRVEKEVIGEGENGKDNPELTKARFDGEAERYITSKLIGRNQLRKKQRTRLTTLRKEG